MIRLARPSLGAAETRAVEAVLASGMLVQGERVRELEALVAERTRRVHAVAVSTGTGALELALAVLDIGAGDDVLVPDLTWPSPAHAVRLRGATPVLVDVDPREWNATPEAFARARTPRTRAAIVIDQFGFPARHGEIASALAGVPVIEDAACAIGATCSGEMPAGAHGVIACLSFHPRKVVTTGEGGMCLTDDPALADRLRVLRNHGQAAPGRFVEPGPNQRLTEMQAAIGVAQMSALDGILARRRDLAARYREALAPIAGLVLQEPAPGTSAIWQTFGVLLPERTDRAAAIDALRARDIEAGLLSYALHRLPSVVPGGSPGDDARFPNASALADRGIALPLHAELTDADADAVVRAFRSILPAAP